MNSWIDDDDVRAALNTQDFSALDSIGIPYCVSRDNQFCVFVRPHSAWQVSRGKWRDANSAPDPDGEYRLMLNFIAVKPEDANGLWFKVFVPLNMKIDSLRTCDSDRYELIADGVSRIGMFSRIAGLAWQMITGHAQSEQDICRRFALVWQ